MKPAFPPARSGAADSYGPYVSEELIVKALAPYPPDLVIATYGEDRASVRSRHDLAWKMAPVVQTEIDAAHVATIGNGTYKLGRRGKHNRRGRCRGWSRGWRRTGSSCLPVCLNSRKGESYNPAE